jgi:NIMA (never in mitosis gene a)-related kinase
MKHLKTEEKADAVKEGKLLEAFSHPFIIKFRDVYRTTKDKLCVVMDFAEGGDLKTAIDKQNGAKFDENTILDWFVQICCALKHVHDRKVLHRDIKSQNIFLDASRKVKLGDFGIAKTLDDTFDMATSVVGTPYYLSPEIVNSKPYSFKSDIWALGVVLYEMCELRPPFMATSLHGLVMKINSGDYAPISEQFSVSLDNLIQALLTNDPELRPNIN